MEVPRALLQRLFRDTRFPLVRHHLDSYDDFLFRKVPTLLRANNPHVLKVDDTRVLRIFFGGRDGDAIRYLPPKDEVGQAILPHHCRLDGRTYSLEVQVDVEVEYTVGPKVVTEKIPNFTLGSVPLMLRSKPCYLTQLEPEKAFEAGECLYELGGYFVITGMERALLTQEVLGNNMYNVAQRSNVTTDATGKKTLIERAPAFKVEDPKYLTETETYAQIRSISEDGATGPYSHFLTIPPPTESRRKRLALIQLPGYDQPVPLFSVFEALGVVTDKDLYDTILAGVPDADRVVFDELFTELVLSHRDFLDGRTSSELLASRTRSQSEIQVILNMHTSLFPHVEPRGDDVASLFRRKAYVLGHLTRLAFELAVGVSSKSDREHMRYKRFDASGDLYFQQFKRTFKALSRTMLTEIDKRLTYEKKNYEGEKITNLLQPETMNAFWNSRQILDEFETAHKSLWGGVSGVSQELSRLSFYSTLSMLRRISLQMDQSLNLAAPRRLHGSQYGLVCPTDSPDGRSIGMVKAFTMLSSLATPSSSEPILAMLDKKGLVRLPAIHPSTWDPRWTRVFLNADLIGVYPGDAEALYKDIVKARRAGEIERFVSVSWNRVDNVYQIATDGGRPVRPVYREGVTADQIMDAKTWQDTERYFEWLDAAETETSRLSMEPFHPKLLSEIHPTFNFSPSAAVVPFSDHNAGTRNNFSAAQQQKQAVGWYHTNFKKRFDTIATLLHSPTRPLAQTWVYPYAFGCMPYGQNVIVAILTYGGFNQEDSVLVNQASLKRGLFDTTYFHTYKYMEEFTDVISRGPDGNPSGPHTQMANPLLDKWADVKRLPDADYSYLDADGIVKVGTEIDPKTVLVGMVAPVPAADGTISSYRDVSELPKRGQRGRVDAVYRYRTSDGLLGVRIRVAERRTPTLGDKFASRHGQKGTIGAIVPEEDMPFTAMGVRPDIVVNPHAIPTRMTVGQLLESTCNKLGVDIGALTDATAFTVSNRIPDTAKQMVEAGFEPYGNEVMYNGQTGDMFHVDVFVGPTFYMRLKQMVEDKINYRDTGGRALLTHQPPRGRDVEGGLRIGEMERDVLLAHGISAFAQESMMKRSDGEEFVYAPEEGTLAVTSENVQGTLEMPYSMKLFTQELQAMHISLRVATGHV